MKAKKIKLTFFLACLSILVFGQGDFPFYGSHTGGGTTICGCYVKTDCNQNVAHCNAPKACTKGTKDKYDGWCIKNAFDFWNNGLPKEQINEIARRFDLWFESLSATGGEPNPRLVELAMDTTDLTKKQVELVKLHVLGLITPLWVGRYKPSNLPAKKGFWLHAWDSINADGSFAFPNGYLLPISDELANIGKLIQKGVTSSILTGNRKHFLRAFEKIRKKYPSFSSFGRCEFPHPPEHGHPDFYPDGIECMINEIEPAISALFKSVDSPTLIASNEEKILLKASPNPFSSNTSIIFAEVGEEETEDHQAILSVQDLKSSFSKILWQGNITANEQLIQNVNASDLNGYGTYVVTLTLVDKGLSKQIRIILFP